MKNTFKNLKNKLFTASKLELEEDSDDEDLNLNDICFYDEDGKLKELLERRNTKIINFCKSMLTLSILVSMFFLFLYSLTFNLLFVIIIKIMFIIISVIFSIKPKEMCNFIKEVWNT